MARGESFGEFGWFFRGEEGLRWIVWHAVPSDEEAKENFEVNDEDALRGCRKAIFSPRGEKARKGIGLAL